MRTEAVTEFEPMIEAVAALHSRILADVARPLLDGCDEAECVERMLLVETMAFFLQELAARNLVGSECCFNAMTRRAAGLAIPTVREAMAAAGYATSLDHEVN